MSGRSTFISNNLNHTAVYWASPTEDGWGGRAFSDPAEIDCRWEDRQEIFIDSQGREVRSNAVVYVNQALELGGYLYLGKLTDLPSSQVPEDTDGAMEIRATQNVMNLKADMYMRKVWL